MTDNELAKRDKRYHEGPFKKMVHGILVLFMKLISILPFWMIYGMSDVLYVITKNIVGYRKKVIYENLDHAFPEKTDEEKRKIANTFYKHFCDFALESVKLYSMNQEQMDQRMIMKGLEPIKDYAKKGVGIILLGLHYNNWEWCSSVNAKWDQHLLMIVNPMRGNQALDKFIAHSREKWGGTSIPVHKSARMAINAANNKEPIGLWLGADQTPKATSQFWTMFLNRETPFFSGPEKIAHKTNLPVFFLHIKKIKRGHYEANFIELYKEPAKLDSNAILLGYIRKMEEVIREDPGYYLWSHRRWKHKRPENIKLIE